MAIFSRTPAVNLDGLREALGRRPDVLAAGEGDGVTLAGTRECLALRRGSEWSVWPWEQVGSGSWRGESRTFRWKTVDGAKHEAVLTHAGRLPDLFQERVQASTVVTTVVDAERGQVQIIGRRGLGANPEIHWYAVPSGGADLSDPATSALVVAETDRLRGDYL